MSFADGTSVIPPGWYPDPADDARLRRWDGQQWTQDVLLAPEQEPPAPAWAPAPPEPQASNQPPLGQPVPASPAPSDPPPGAPTPPTAFQSAPEPPARPAQSAQPAQTTVPRPSPPINQNSHPQSGPVSLPEWATLPGLTLPPDLSSLPGMESDSVLLPPTFAEAEKREAPTPPVFEPPFIPQRPDVQEAGRRRAEPAEAAKSKPDAPQQPATPYAPPPSGAQYDVPPPPGMVHVPTAGPVLPRTAFVAPQVPGTTWPQLPPVSSAASASAEAAVTGITASRTAPSAIESSTGPSTVSSWLIAALPLLQFALVYIVFGLLKVTLAPGMQWGILAVPAAFSLLFANADKKKLTSLGIASPSIIFGLIPPLYLIARCVTSGRSSALPLVAWLVLQAAAAAGVYFLLPTVLATAIHAMGLN